MTIAFLGVNHRQARMQDIEAVYLNQDAKHDFLTTYCTSIHLNECVILNTCNRFEIYFEAENPHDVQKKICHYIAQSKNSDPDKPATILKSLEGKEALQHLFNVATGIDSMVFGENEILTQVKESYDASKNLGRTSGLFNKVFQTAVAVGKRVRAETGISRGSYSVSSIAIEAIREKNLDYFGHNILVIGTGVMGKRSVKKLTALGHPDVTVVNRTNQKALDFAKEEKVHFLAYEDLFKRIGDFSIIIIAVSSSEPIIKSTQFSKASKTSLIVDLGLPRNVEETVPDDTGIYVITVDGLREIAEKNVGRRKAEVEKVQTIIDDELIRFNHWETMRNAELHSPRNT